ncbi:hypothetical protein CSA37_12625 [Candidatus Fermentibacteria bacterium]|nr:MAG: hypothetical protein CSA37_12625 [Candidatus Fermentibacteria bacterium]
MPSGMIKSGYSLIAGLANTGKSTLLNCLTGTDISPAVSQASSTRMPITGISTPGNAQICFVDTPPLESRYDWSILNWVDTVVLMLDIRTFEEDLTTPMLKFFLKKTAEKPVILALSMDDFVKAEHRQAYVRKALYTNRFTFCLSVCPASGSGVPELLKIVLENIPMRDRLFPRYITTLNSRRFLVAEQVRARLFSFLPPEVASETAVQVEETSYRDGRLYVRLNILVSRASAKGTVIGRKGQTLERISRASAESIERFTGERCRLDMWVKVREAWPDNQKDMLEFGYVC